ncbi:MAG: winged helix-turn-helix domain-containing protein [Theionarchaea archaeon]|nr:winged helix-turn-helix domain-containing protein [Theionarchaea archaeon]
MENMKDLNSTEMKLLHYMGKDPELTNAELAQLLGLKNPPYISTLKADLEEKQYFVGPYYQTNYGRIFKNRVRKSIAIILFEQPYEYMFALLKNIDCFSYLYPIEERFFKSYMAGIFDSNTEAIKRIFDYLKREGVIFHYDLYIQNFLTHMIPPTFLTNSEGAPFDPPLNNLLENTETPNLSFGEFERMSLSPLERNLISSFEMGVTTLTQIMEQEKARGNFFTYAEWKDAKEQLVNRRIIQPVYDVFPFPAVYCSYFFLFVSAYTLHDIQKILFNFGKNARLRKMIFVWTSYQTGKTYGVIYCISHPEFTIRLLRQLDKYEEIKDKKLFMLRKKIPLWRALWQGKSISLEEYDPESCTLYYPYDTYYEKVKTYVEENPW